MEGREAGALGGQGGDGREDSAEASAHRAATEPNQLSCRKENKLAETSMRRMAGRWHKCGTNERRRDDSSHMGGQELLIEYQQVGARSATKKTDRELN